MSNTCGERPMPDVLQGRNLTTSNLALRRVAIGTYRENVADLHRDCAVYRAGGFQARSKVEVRANGRRILATLNVVDDPSIVGCDQLGLSEDVFLQLAVTDGHTATVSQAELPESVGALFGKIAGEPLSHEDFRAIVRDIAELRYSTIELTAFVVATHRDELDRKEVYFLTKAMMDSGRKLDWHEPLVVAKHGIGGIPGNRTSMLVVPIVAAHGLLCPKTSSRAITSPAGAADTMDVLAKVKLCFDQLADIVRVHRGCLAWGGTVHLSPADNVLISVERRSILRGSWWPPYCPRKLRLDQPIWCLNIVILRTLNNPTRNWSNCCWPHKLHACLAPGT